MKNNLLLLTVISILLITSCSNDPKPYHLPDNAMQLMHGDSLKVWKIARRYNDDVRMNMGPCFLNYRQTFKVYKQVFDNNETNRDCGPSLVGKWEFKKGEKG